MQAPNTAVLTVRQVALAGALEIDLFTRVAKLEANNLANSHAIRTVAKYTRNRVGTVTAVCIALAINLGAQYLHEHYNLAAYEWLLEQEKILATDTGVRIREIIDYDTNRFAPMPSGVVMIGLTPVQTQQYVQNVILTESGGNWTVINEQGYHGIGQFGASALAAVGLVDRTKFRAALANGTLRGKDGWIGQKQWLQAPANWLIDGGVNAFLNNKQLQVAAMIRLANMNIQYGYQVGALHRTDSPQKHAGFAKASHLVGCGRAAFWYKYRLDRKDGNGTRASKYAADGERAITS